MCQSASLQAAMYVDGLQGGSARWGLGAVCGLSAYARRSIARVKYQEHLKQIEEVAETGARAGKCTL